MAKLLVTGGAGFIGSNFVHYWRARHPQDRLVVLDLLTYAGLERNLAPLIGQAGFRFVHGDIADEALVTRLLEEERIDRVVHLAAETHVDRSISGPGVFVEANVRGTLVLLEAARQVWLSGSPDLLASSRFHHVSTDEVYGSLGPADSPVTEEARYLPSSPYAASKAAADHLARAYHRTYGLPVTISNCANNYGPRQFPEKLIPLAIVSVLNGREMPVYGDGSNVRDWLHVEDHCRGLELLLARGRIGETYHVGARNERRNIDVLQQLCRLIDRRFAEAPDLARRFPHAPPAHGERSESVLQSVPDRAGHDFRYALDTAKIERELGFAPTAGQEDGLAGTVDWYLSNPDWWSDLVEQRE